MIKQTALTIPETKARPFLKWAGGKTQLIPQMSNYFPRALKEEAVKTYVEPFVGSGALFFHVAQTYEFPRLFISDVNDELILVYKTVRQDVESLIDLLDRMQIDYLALNPKRREMRFYDVREEFNARRSQTDFLVFDKSWIERSAQFIFLNRTCFNGLYRVNAKAEFNVPFGRYHKPLISSPENLRAVANILQRTEIECGDFTSCEPFVNSNTFVYFDPPYRPISSTSNFTSYSRFLFDDNQQHRLVEFFKKLDAKGAFLMLSNSDPKNENPNDNFFDIAYDEFRIVRVHAKRMINCDATKRGKISELLIMNYGSER